VLYRQAFWNLAGHEQYVLEKDLAVRPGIPAVVVGSGFSLNENFDDLRSARDGVCIISCGTALLPLLEHGIRPHIHCELESVQFIRNILQFTASRYDLSGIVLAASNTVVPGVADIFDRKMFCFREGVAATRVLNEEVVPLPLIAPACTNTGLRFAYALGFRDIYLCGVDLGSTTPESHHADGSVYHHIDAYNQFIGNTGQKIPPRGSATGRYDRAVEGNFGGTVQTNPNMLQMRSAFEIFARAMPDARLRNCSDGAFISGFEPTRSAELGEMRPCQETSVGVLEEGLSMLRKSAPKELIEIERLRAFDAALLWWAIEAEKAIGVASSTDADFLALYGHLDPMLLANDLEPNSKSIVDTCRYVHTGSFLKVLHFARYASARLPAADAAVVLRVTMEVISRALNEIKDKHLRQAVSRSLVWWEADPTEIRERALTGWRSNPNRST